MVPYAKRRDSMNYIIDCMHKIMESLTNKDLISFGGGAPAREAYPIGLIGDLTQSIFGDEEKAIQALAYGATIGLPSLRKAVQDHLLVPNGIAANLDEIMITAGGIQGIFLVCKLYLDPGDVVLVESPTFIHAKLLFDSFEATCQSCAMDEDGLNIEDLESKIKKYHPKLIYTMPTFHNPTGISMSEEKRKRMAELAETYDVMILEDDPYSEIRYSGEKLKPIKAHTKSKNVIYANSLSKIFSPGARLGYLVADAAIMQELTEMKLAIDTCTNGLTQMICAEFFSGGHYPSHLRGLCDIYRSRRDVMQKGIDDHFPKGTKRTSPDGGYYIWVELPQGLDGRELLPAANEVVKITYGSGSDFFVEENHDGSQFLRFSFAGIEEAVIENAMAQLGSFFKSKL
ncbi:MAG: PLP-dependent aminotransferase family protein [Clostridia bacterium]|nr:PLP-dependent aminotransferase family protein [Clostridia bacterium]